ncbi:MAG: hypothetical protein G01um10147_234 [Microgenomates group bacterium Gr01-1014_7]|nr:MAG: hypothetical protein G01um10147_234 [Microgenomates group bacterium Gr01-1014_7]
MLPKIIIVGVILALGFIGFRLIQPDRSQPAQNLPGNTQNQPNQQSSTGMYGSKAPFYNEDGITLQHYWPSEGSFSAEETEILLFNGNSQNLQVKSFDLSYMVERKTYPQKSGTWEKFPAKDSWEKIEYIMISPQYYKGEQLLLTPGQKGKLHWHMQFGSQPLDGKQTVNLKLTLLKGSETINIDEQFNRNSGVVVSKEDH